MKGDQFVNELEHRMNSAKGEDGFCEIYWERLKEIIDLISCKDSEIDMLIRKKEKLMDKLAELQAENERLKADNEILSTQLHYTARELEEVKITTF